MYFRVLMVSLFMLFVMAGCGNEKLAIQNNNGERIEEIQELSKNPPRLTVVVDGLEISPVQGTYSWSYPNGDGTFTSVNADTAGPPDLIKSLKQVDVTSKSKIILDFEKDPLSYQVRIWHSDYTTTDVNKESYGLSEHKGLLVYEVLAKWQEGTTTYAFLLNNE